MLSQTYVITFLSLLCLPSTCLSEVPGQSLSEQQYQKALELRGNPDASNKQLAQAATLLKAAAGVKILKADVSLEDNELMRDDEYDEIAAGVQVAKTTHTASLRLLSDLYFLGNQGAGVNFNPRAAFALMRHAAKHGDPQAQREVGLWLSLGIQEPPEDHLADESFSLGEPDWQTGFIHLYQAAVQNDTLAQMALGYRYATGIGVRKNCSTAAIYYGAVAEDVIKAVERKEISPFGYLKVDRIPLSAQSGMFKVSRDQERLHYQWFADMGYVDAQRAVGRLLSQGDHDEALQALRYFRKAAEAGDAEAQGHLGHHYANGIGVPQSNDTALQWFRAAANGGSPSAQFGLGYMYLHGHGVPKDYRLAQTYLKQAGEKGHAEAWFHLGTMHMNGWGVPVSPPTAQNFFALAAKVGHVLAQYNLAMTFLAHPESCGMGLQRLKEVAERGSAISLLQDSFDQFSNTDYDLALMGYLKAGELGFELAQVNAAWMIGKGYGLPVSDSHLTSASVGNFSDHAAALSMKANQRASQQGNVEAMLSVADTYYYGRGVPRNWPSAFKLYASAANYGKSGQAFFNLGYMHQMGLGVAHDPALAKRNYDKAVEVQHNAIMPVKIALLLLSLQNWCEATLPPWILRSVQPSVADSELEHPAGQYLPKASLSSTLIGFLDSLQAGVWDPAGIWSVQYQAIEHYVLIGLVGLLALVLLRRRQIRATPNRGGPGFAPPAQAPAVAQQVVGPTQQADDSALQNEQSSADPTAQNLPQEPILRSLQETTSESLSALNQPKASTSAERSAEEHSGGSKPDREHQNWIASKEMDPRLDLDRERVEEDPELAEAVEELPGSSSSGTHAAIARGSMLEALENADRTADRLGKQRALEKAEKLGDISEKEPPQEKVQERTNSVATAYSAENSVGLSAEQSSRAEEGVGSSSSTAYEH